MRKAREFCHLGTAVTLWGTCHSLFVKLGKSQVDEANTDRDCVLVLSSPEVTACLSAFNQLGVVFNTGHMV